MARIDIDDVLRGLAESARDKEDRSRPPGDGDGDAVLDEQVLADYRQGHLEPETARNVESRLAADPRSRYVLARGTGESSAPPPSAAPPASVRDAVLASFQAASGTDAQVDPSLAPAPTSVPAAPRPGRRMGWSLAAAAAFVLAVFSAQLFDRPVGGLPPFAVSVSTSEVRAATPPVVEGKERSVDVEPDEPFKITLSPTWQVEKGIDVGVFRRRGARLERIDDTSLVGRDVNESVESGTFIVRQPGDVLDGADTGMIWVVVGYQGALDRTIRIDADIVDSAIKKHMEDSEEWLLYPIEVHNVEAL